MAVLAERLSVIGSDDDQRVLQLTAPPEGIEQPSDLLVEICDGAVVAVDVGLILLRRRSLPVPSPRSSESVNAAKAPVVDLRSKLFIERRGRHTWLVRVQIVEESEEGALTLAIKPLQKRTVDVFSRFSPNDVMVIDQAPRRVSIENGAAQRCAERHLRKRDRIIFVVGEAAAEAVFGVAIVRVSDEAGGQIAARAERFGQRRVCAVERRAKIRAHLPGKSPGKYRGVRRQRPRRCRYREIEARASFGEFF